MRVAGKRRRDRGRERGRTQAINALALLHQNGYQTDSDLLQAPMWDSQAVPAVAVTYGGCATRKRASPPIFCDFSFGTTSATGAAGVTPAVSPMLTVFGNGNGVPPTNGINLVFNSGGGAADHRLATPDGSYAGASCLRTLWTNGTLTNSVEGHSA
ncbi:3-hydroxybutyrate oligomer hydrolase family protein [Paraburkholderia dipogonis]|uniref:3-hydroxybutyrate oligomer hydrolase family protein n=1 Tax=Paraburkholderia dipogonis TaxID=1211383 RepID=UPI0035F0706F